MKWCKDPKAEAFMRSKHIAFEVSKIRVGDIDTDLGLTNQGRLLGNKLDDNAVLNMSINMLKEDSAYSMIILQRPRHGKPWPLSGNHRTGAYILAFNNPDDVIDAYTVNITDPVLLELFPRSINTIESPIGFSKADRIWNARYFIERHGMTTNEAADWFGIKPNQIYQANAVEDAKKIVAEVVPNNGFSASTLRGLNTIADSQVIKATAKVLHDYKIKGDEARELINSVKEPSSSLQKLAELGRYEKTFNERSQSKQNKPKRTGGGAAVMTRNVQKSFLRYLTGLARVLHGKTALTQLQITDPADLLTVEKNWKLIKSTMEKLERVV